MKVIEYNYDDLYRLYPEMMHYLYNGREVKTQLGFDNGWYPIIKNALSLMYFHVKNHNENREKAIIMNEHYNALEFDKLPAYIRERAKAGDASAIPEIKEVKTFPTFMQIKEKFGTLRMYGSKETSDDYHSGIIHMAENICAITCEVTGLPGKLMIRNSGLYKIVSETYANETGGWVAAQ